MSDMIRAHNNYNQPLIPTGHLLLPRTWFNLVHLKPGESYTTQVPGYESCWVVMHGACVIDVDELRFEGLTRADIWTQRNADAVYASAGAKVHIVAGAKGVSLAAAGARCDTVFAPFRIAPKDVRMVEVGSLETHTRRCIHHILGAKDEGRTGNLLVSELYAESGCWSGYPPHKHGNDCPQPTGQGWLETGFEEVYHYRFKPETGFGAQFNYREDGAGGVWQTNNGDTFLIRDGYHPTVSSPGHACYIFTILVGHTTHSLVQNFQPKHRHLCSQFPGVQNMVDLFTGAQK